MRELVEERKRKMLAFLADGSAEEDILGAAALAQLLLGIGNEEVINARLCRTADWYHDPCPYKARDPRGESDFAALKFIRFLYMAEDKLSAEARDTILDFFMKHDFESKYKSENHMLLFHVSRYLLAQKYPDAAYPVYGKNGESLMEEDGAFLTDYLQFRAKQGWAEFDSLGYYSEDMRALLTLYDFAKEEKIRNLAEMSLNLMLLDMIDDSMGPLYCGAHGRIYGSAALDYKNSGIFAVYWVYLGGEKEVDALKHSLLEVCLSRFAPADFVYDVLAEKPETYENFESHHLHCISTEIPHRQVPQVAGSINKYTYVCPWYAMGAVNYQDPYPEDSDAKWYAHHQQHEWDLTLPGGTDIRIFTHHPGSFGTEGAEHGYWTGDLGCCCGQFFCEKNVVLATYDIPEKEMQCINANGPLEHFERIEQGNYLFLRHGQVYVSLWFSNGYEAADGAYAEREIRSYGSRHGVVCEVGTAEEYGSFESFRNRIAAEEILFRNERMSLSYRTLSMDHTAREIDGKQVLFPYPAFRAPAVNAEFDSGIVRVTTRKADVLMDFNRIETVTASKNV